MRIAADKATCRPYADSLARRGALERILAYCALLAEEGNIRLALDVGEPGFRLHFPSVAAIAPGVAWACGDFR